MRGTAVRNIRSKLHEERGQMLVLVVLLTTVMLGVVGLAIDEFTNRG